MAVLHRDDKGPVAALTVDPSSKARPGPGKLGFLGCC